MNTRITFDNLDQRVTFRFADASNVPELLYLYELYHEEAIYKDYLEFDRGRARENMREGIVEDTRPYILAIVDERIAGFVAYTINHMYWSPPFVVMLELYVRPEYRRSAVGRSLVAMLVLESKATGAGAIHAPVSSGLKEVKSLFNLFRKAGFHQIGYVMRRGLA